MPPRAPAAPLACLPSPYQQTLRSPRLPRPGSHPSPASFPFAPKLPGLAHPLRSAPRQPVRLPCQPPSLTPLPQLRCQPPSLTPLPQLSSPRAGSPFHPVPPAATQLSRTRDATLRCAYGISFVLPLECPAFTKHLRHATRPVRPFPLLLFLPPLPAFPSPSSPPTSLPTFFRPPALSDPPRTPPPHVPSPLLLLQTLPPCPHPSAFVVALPLAAVAILLNCPPRISLPSTRPPPPPPRSPQAACSKLPRPCSFSTLAARAHPPSLSFPVSAASSESGCPATESPHWGLNPGPSVYRTDALPLSYRGSSSATAPAPRSCQAFVPSPPRSGLRILWHLLAMCARPWWARTKNQVHFSICACHPCAGAMLIFSVSFQF